MPPYFFVSQTNGALYDTRRDDWASHPLRDEFRQHFRFIESGRQLRACLRAGAHAWPGGYALAFVTCDGETLSFQTVRNELESVTHSIRTQSGDGWQVVGLLNTAETDAEIYCSHTGERIE